MSEMALRQARIAVAALVLAGCSSDPADPAPVPDEVIEEQMRKLANVGEFFRAGQWESRSDLLDLGGVTEADADAVKRRIGGQTFSTCLTSQEVTEPQADFFTGAASDCTYTRFSMDDGRIEAAMRCVTGAIVQETNLKGSYTPERYDIELTSVGEAPAAMRMTMAIAARRVGDCAILGPAGPAPTNSTGENDDEE